MSPEEEDDYERGLVYERVPEVLTRGHVVSPRRVDLIEERATYSKYLLLPTKFSFPKVVRIYSIVLSFVSNCRRGKILLSKLLCEGKLWFSMFHAQLNDLETGKELRSIAMVTSAEGETSPISMNLVNKFSEELFLSEGQRRSFEDIQVKFNG